MGTIENYTDENNKPTWIFIMAQVLYMVPVYFIFTITLRGINGLLMSNLQMRKLKYREGFRDFCKTAQPCKAEKKIQTSHYVD